MKNQNKKPEILLVDDDAESTELLAELLVLEGYAVTCTANGREALEYLEHSNPPCLIILDLMMPIMNGWEFRKRQKNDPKLSSLPVIVVSATSPVLNMDVDALRKPVDVARLMRAVKETCVAA